MMMDHEKLMKLMELQFSVYMSTLGAAQDFIRVRLSMPVDKPRDKAKSVFVTLIDLILTSETLSKADLVGVLKEVNEEFAKE